MSFTTNYYFVKAEDDVKDFIKVPTRLLFNNYDKRLTTVLINDKGCYNVAPFNFTYTSDQEEYKFSCFKYDKDYHPLSSFQKKLLSLFSSDWYNKLLPVLQSEQFVTLLKHIAKIRTEKEVSPSKDDMFKFLMNRIEDTEIPDSLLNEEVVGVGFLNHCKQIKQQRISTKKKFDY